MDTACMERPADFRLVLRPKHKGSAQLFQEPGAGAAFAHAYCACRSRIFCSTTVISLYYGFTRGLLSGASALGLFHGGLADVHTSTEYAVHRYVYHIPATSPGRAKFQYTMHGVHHEYPKDKTRLAMPPILTVFVASLLFFIFRLRVWHLGVRHSGRLHVRLRAVLVCALCHSRVLSAEKLS
ncbi:MAG: hypothetical protein WKG07_44650 [Hymenobacter sp.]